MSADPSSDINGENRNLVLVVGDFVTNEEAKEEP